MERVLCLLIGYALGHFQTAVIYGKLKGVDIRKVGSGNAGTTNTSSGPIKVGVVNNPPSESGYREANVKDMETVFSKENGYELDITDKRLHHEIYLSDPRKCDVSKLKTVIRHPIKKNRR